MAKFNKGDVVVVVVDDEDVAKGTELTVKSGPVGYFSGGNYRFKETDEIVLGDSLALVSQKPTKKQRIKALESEVAELKAKVEALEKSQAKPKVIPVTTDNIEVGDKIRVVNVRAIDDCGANLVQGGTYVVVRVDPDGNFLIRNGAKEAYIVEEEFRYIEKVSE